MTIKLVRSGSCSRCVESNCCEGCGFFEKPNICTIYFERPKDRGCILWPPTPFERPPNCTFHFYNAETGEEIIGYKDQELRKTYEAVNEPC